MARVIGIDLGTTYSCVATLEGGKPVVIPNLEGLPTTPSVVSFTASGERLVGTLALRQAVTNPANTFYAVKRLIGQKFRSAEIQEAMARLPYGLTEAPNGDVALVLGDRRLSPPEISAMVLGYLKECAEAFFGESVTDAVITVPAHFNDAQRQATKDAATICGLDVRRVINEPTAAGLAFGLDARKNGLAAVYDLGGGTFDITVLEASDGVFNVLATNGDSYLGGEDFDNRILEWLVTSFKAETGLDLGADRLALQRLKEAAEKAKRELSFTTETEINLPFITAAQSKSNHIRKSLSRKTFEAMTVDLVERTLPRIEQALADARIGRDRIDQVILVGGQTRMPLVKERVTAFFGRAPEEKVDPDQIVAMGAAIQSGILDGQVRDLVLLLDVTPFALGIETENDGYEMIIERNTTIPTRKVKAFTTVEHNQRRVRIHVLQGEGFLASMNKSLAVFELVGIEPAPAGVPQIDVTFEITADGLVQVSAKDKETGLEQRIEVRPSSGLSAADVEAMRKRQAGEEKLMKLGPNG
jgi:molecular chaperone DnaK